MNQEEQIELILSIEQQIDVTQITYKGIHIWPHVRQAFRSQLMHVGKYKMDPIINLPAYADKLANQFYRPETYVPYLTHCQQRFAHLARLTQIGPVDILFFSQPEYHTDVISGKYYNRHIDPMIELVKDRYRYIKLELNAAKKTETTQPRAEHTVFVDSEFYLRWDAHRSVLRAFQQKSKGPAIHCVEELKRVLAPYYLHLSFNEAQCAIDMERYIHLREYFKDMLNILKPRAVFHVCYYSLWGLALNMACRQLGIVSVDVQHGKQGKFHAMYSHWHNIPAEGYAMLPDYFWSWGRESVENIIHSRLNPETPHRPVVGGHRWLAKWIEPEEASPVLSKEAEVYVNHLQTYERTILVSLQPFEDPLPPQLIEAMKRSPRSWYWMIRLHPMQLKDIDAISRRVSQIAPHAEVKTCSRLPLYALLRQADHHVTCWSSVCYEALYFGLRTTFIDPDGALLYKDYIDKRLFSVSNTSAELLDEIRTNSRLDSLLESVRYIETNTELALETMDKILVSPRQKMENYK